MIEKRSNIIIHAQLCTRYYNDIRSSMNLTEGILIVIIIILILVVITRGKQPGGAPGIMREWDCIDKKTGEVTGVKMAYTGPGLGGAHGNGCKCPNCSSPELNSTKENYEHFAAGCDSESQLALQRACGDGDFAYATNDYGAPGLSYVDVAMSSALDPAIVKNHSEFVKDRLGGNDSQTILGRAWTPQPTVENADQISWQGLRRPQSVPVCNPTQVSDVDYNWYDTKPKFTWSSS